MSDEEAAHFWRFQAEEVSTEASAIVVANAEGRDLCEMDMEMPGLLTVVSGPTGLEDSSPSHVPPLSKFYFPVKSSSGPRRRCSGRGAYGVGIGLRGSRGIWREGWKKGGNAGGREPPRGVNGP